MPRRFEVWEELEDWAIELHESTDTEYERTLILGRRFFQFHYILLGLGIDTADTGVVNPQPVQSGHPLLRAREAAPCLC